MLCLQHTYIPVQELGFSFLLGGDFSRFLNHKQIVCARSAYASQLFFLPVHPRSTNEPLTSMLSRCHTTEPQQLLDAGANEHRYLAQAAVLDFKLLEVMTLQAQKEDQKLQKYFHSGLLRRTPVSFMPNSKNLPCWMCGNACIKSSSCSFRSLDPLYFFRCVLQALSSQIPEVNWISENKQNKMFNP